MGREVTGQKAPGGHDLLAKRFHQSAKVPSSALGVPCLGPSPKDASLCGWGVPAGLGGSSVLSCKSVCVRVAGTGGPTDRRAAVGRAFQCIVRGKELTLTVPSVSLVGGGGLQPEGMFRTFTLRGRGEGSCSPSHTALLSNITAPVTTTLSRALEGEGSMPEPWAAGGPWRSVGPWWTRQEIRTPLAVPAHTWRSREDRARASLHIYASSRTQGAGPGAGRGRPGGAGGPGAAPQPPCLAGPESSHTGAVCLCWSGAS